jgi:hypothetical protein
VCRGLEAAGVEFIEETEVVPDVALRKSVMRPGLKKMNGFHLTWWRRAWSVAGLVFAVLMNVLLDWRVGLRAYRAALDANQAAVAL